MTAGHDGRSSRPLRGIAAALALTAATVFAQATPPPTAPPAPVAPPPAPVGTPAAPAGAAAATPAAAASTVQAADSSAAREPIRKAQASALEQLAALEALSGTAEEAPPGTPPKDIAERLTLARQHVGVYQQQLDALDRSDAARTALRDIERTSENWPGFGTPPPYSALRVDALRDEEESAAVRIDQANARRALFERIETQFTAKMEESQAAARLAAESADGARGTPQFRALDWARHFTALRATVDGETLSLLQMGIRSARDEAAAATAERDFARRKLALVGGAITLPPDDFSRVVAELDGRRRALEREVERATRDAAAALETRVQAERLLAAARAAPVIAEESPATRATQLADLGRDADLAREAAATAAQRVDLLRETLLLVEGERTVWEARAEAMRGRNPVEARIGYDKLSTSLAGVNALMQYLDQQLDAVRTRITDTESTARGPLTAESLQAQRLLEILRRRESDLSRAIASGQPVERLLARFRADFEERREASASARIKDTVAGGLIAVRRLWNFELFTVDDSFETADGRKLTVARSITIGKSFGAVLIVIVGYWICSLIGRRVERAVVARGRVAPQSARLLRKWAMFAIGAILVIFALVTASIPLTAFAFLGGALAIAAGFGLQTLLKNLVSGVMLLVERPLRLGDLVEVDGIRGRITEIGIRASTIRSSDGIESMIPNSRFIEGSVTNWTYTGPQTRQTITIGVAYGTELRKAADLLLGVLAEHGHVLKSPGPQVYLDAYADSSINFALTYWVEMLVDNDSRRVKSDLLHMIDRAFAEAGIAMPFPQRDVHLDIGKPVPVEIIRHAPDPGGSG